MDDPSPYGVVALGTTVRYSRFVEKPAPGGPSNLINAGIYVFEPETIAAIARGRRVSMEREVLPTLSSNGEVFALDSDAYWIDTGTPASYIRAQLDVIAGLRPNVLLPDCEQSAWACSSARRRRSKAR